jgi:predicted nucleic acid-binding protein
VSRSLVVDASVALKWVVIEPGSEEAASLLDEMTVGAATLLAPEHLVGEVAMGNHGLRRAVRAAGEGLRRRARNRRRAAPHSSDGRAHPPARSLSSA